VVIVTGFCEEASFDVIGLVNWPMNWLLKYWYYATELVIETGSCEEASFDVIGLINLPMNRLLKYWHYPTEMV